MRAEEPHFIWERELEQTQYRHEYKYPLTLGQIRIEECRIRGIMEKDAHAKGAGFYNIRSLYFDDYDNSCYLDNENGADNREKYRIRIYNGDAGRISLELKRKIRGKTHKSSCLITGEQCHSLMEGRIPSRTEAGQQVLNKLACQMALRLMRPVVIVDYDRIPYVYRARDANVRVTFDCNLRSCADVGSFLYESVQGRGVLPVGKALMEVKFDSFLPDEIYTLLQLEGLTASTFSKYYLCRKFM